MDGARLFDIKTFKEITEHNMHIDSSIRDKIKDNLESLLNIRIIESDFHTGENERVDIIALGSENNPLIVLFQSVPRESMVAKAVFYLDWITNNKNLIIKLVSKAIPNMVIDSIDWEKAGVFCIGWDFSRYDRYMVLKIERPIELIQCKKYDRDLLVIETVYKPTVVKFPRPAALPLAAPSNVEQTKAKKYIKVSQTPRIGYCQIEDGKHYVVFPGKEKGEILDIPVSIYLAQNQFVLVDEYNRFQYAFPYWLNDNETASSNAASFAVVMLKDSEVFIDKGDNVLVKLNNIPSNVQLRDKNIVSVDSQNNFLRFYKQVKHNADSFMMSAKAKGHTLAFVLKILDNGVLLRDIETGKEFFKDMDTEGVTFKEQQILCLQEGSIVHTLTSCKFYTLSSFYDKFEYGTVEIKDGLTFLKKLSGEIVIINDAPDYLRPGQVAYVDENNNFCGIEDDGEGQEADTVKRNVSNISTFKRVSKKERIEVTKQVLILGNKAYENSYKLCLLKFGYKAEVLEGFEPWAKISNELRDTDVVVVVTSHISHDNMWRVKKEITDIPVVYSEFDGANRILEQVIAAENSWKEIRTAR
ncbi:MAG TPA: DUF2325 domain-containing protein [Acetivibrio sp.]|uniref:DUF2325 domain-containing protein n=1 Tax=Acetivibrio sp. TaxID=1872092 RepID=UPI002C6E06FE|nr:DUF2325 domain-containing protein [Acetivibrio sp.]HOM02825.1 DUF2325 domain-containing protein [Acetivibrio sp.]